MQLIYNPASPFARKALVLAHETGLFDRIERRAVTTTPLNTDAELARRNPLGKLPCMVLSDGRALYDSRVICEYLDRLHSNRRFFPAEGPQRWRALTLQALADGLCDAAVATRYELTIRPEDKQWNGWVEAQKGKIRNALDRLEDEAEQLTGLPDIGHVAAACALSYLDFRFAEDGWREGRPILAEWHESFAQRPSMQATRTG